MIIDHGDHYHSLIAHAERLMKGVGDPVKRGELVATVGNTGSSNTTQLYFEIRHHGKPVNPMEWLASGK
jgi:septal ring factor EnvC (AmiA/AmiB activator)